MAEKQPKPNSKGLIAVRLNCDKEIRMVDPARAAKLVSGGNGVYVDAVPEVRTATAKPGRTASRTKAQTNKLRIK